MSGGTSHLSFVRALACLLQEKLTGVYGACAQYHMVPSVMISMHDERNELRANSSRAITQDTFVTCTEEIRNLVGAPSGFRHHILLPAFYLPTPAVTRYLDTVMTSGIVAASAFIRNTLGYSFTDTRLLEEALDSTGLRSPGSNGRLAMIGDSRLKDVILDDWYASGASKGS